MLGRVVGDTNTAIPDRHKEVGYATHPHTQRWKRKSRKESKTQGDDGKSERKKNK